MSDIVLVAIVTGTFSLIAAVIAGVISIKQIKLNKKIQEENEKMERRAEQRKQESLLAMELSHANTQLTIGVAMALKNGYANGEIEYGLELVNKSSEKYSAFIRQMANEHLQ